ncbi:MAG: alpha-1,4-glucan--maltose-1-phosphate maltosyltransferase [Acidimicrobiales bacterium]
MVDPLVIEAVRPSTPTGYPPKAVVGERVTVSADIYRDGHDLIAARVRWRPDDGEGEGAWRVVPMQPTINDRWEATIEPGEVGPHEFVIEAWTDRYGTWAHDVEIKAGAGQDVELELEEGARIVEFLARYAADDEATQRLLAAASAGLRDDRRSADARLNAGLDDYVHSLLSEIPDPTDLTDSPLVPLWVDPPIGRFGAWYEFFPRSEGGFVGSIDRLPAVADMGFDIVYLPPIHPIGRTFRKGRNNTLVPQSDDPGSPWAIGGAEGGHTAVHPELGTIDDFDRFVAEANALGLQVALDYALQCSPDHPWVKEHPEWFHHRPDGTIKYAENPPKKYQDIYPINFWPPDDADRHGLWRACKEILDHWIAHGVRLFRVDNPHTKPFAFWVWLIGAVRTEHPDVVLLAEAFTRPKVMAKLAEIGFTQSYTYFAWRTARWEIEEYVNELAHTQLADYMRPNFWPNTPDILSGPLRHGPLAAFKLRLVLAATLVPAYGIYSGYELGENEPASDTNEEYLYSEKYEIKRRNWDAPNSLAQFIAQINEIRHRHPAFAELRTIRFHGSANDQIIAYSKTDPTGGDPVLVVVNLDPHHTHETTLFLDLGAIGMPEHGRYEAHDEVSGRTFEWEGSNPYVKLDPDRPAHICALRVRVSAPVEPAVETAHLGPQSTAHSADWERG